MVYKCLIRIIAILLVLLPNFYPYPTVLQKAKAATNPVVTITFRVATNFPDAPVGMILTDLGAVKVLVEVEQNASGDNVTIRAKRGDYPSSISDGELVYSGNDTAITATGFALDTSDYYFRAWSYNGTYSQSYIEAAIGGEKVEEIANQIGDFNTLMASFNTLIGNLSSGINTIAAQYLLLLVVIIIVIFAFWHRDRNLYILSGFAMLTYGFSFWSTNHYLSLILVGVGIYLFIKARFDKKKNKA